MLLSSPRADGVSIVIVFAIVFWWLFREGLKLFRYQVIGMWAQSMSGIELTIFSVSYILEVCGNNPALLFLSLLLGESGV